MKNFSLLKTKKSIQKEDNKDISLMEIYDSIKNKELIPFKMIFKIMKDKYEKSTNQKELDEIMTKYIIDEELSEKYLNQLISSSNINIIQDHFDSMYIILKFFYRLK